MLKETLIYNYGRYVVTLWLSKNRVQLDKNK